MYWLYWLRSLFAPKKPSLALIILGQSNACNEAKGSPYNPKHPAIQQLDVHVSKLCLAWDPLLGVDRVMGGTTSFMLPLADALSGGAFNVVLAPIAVPSTSCRDWVPGGFAHLRIAEVIQQLKALAIPVAAILWMQGETDAAAKTDPEVYKADVRVIAKEFRDALGMVPFYVPIETFWNGNTYSPLQQAQREIPDGAVILAGPNFDALGEVFRQDGTHFNLMGAAAVASCWEALLKTRFS